MTQRILLVAGARDGSVRRVLELRGFAISTVNDVECVVELLTESPIDLVVVNLDETENGLDLIKRSRDMEKLNALSILAIGDWGTGKATLALARGADAYEPTPINATRLIESLDRLLNKRAAVAGMNQ